MLITESQTMNCSVCEKPLDPNCYIKSYNTFLHSECKKLLTGCTKCGRELVCPQTQTRNKCLGCGNETFYYSCDVCKYRCDEGKLERGRLICNRCKKVCFYCHKSFVHTYDPKKTSPQECPDCTIRHGNNYEPDNPW